MLAETLWVYKRLPIKKRPPQVGGRSIYNPFCNDYLGILPFLSSTTFDRCFGRSFLWQIVGCPKCFVSTTLNVSGFKGMLRYVKKL